MLTSRMVLWTVGLYALGSMFGSMLLQLYSAAPVLSPKAPQEISFATRWCAASIGRLRVELAEQAANLLQDPSVSMQTSLAWDGQYAQWRGRVFNASQGCERDHGAVGEGFETLEQLGETYNSALHLLFDNAIPRSAHLKSIVASFND